MSQIKNVLRVKKMQKFIPYQECVIIFNVSSTVMGLLQIQKNHSKTKKNHYLINREFDQKDI